MEKSTNVEVRRLSVNFWFADGKWRFYCPSKRQSVEISSLMREVAYDFAALAKALGMGQRTFRRVVKVCLGIPPGQWLRQERAVAARYRLRDGGSIKQVARELGFRHAGDFCVEFTRWYGTTPSRFVQTIRESTGLESER